MLEGKITPGQHFHWERVDGTSSGEAEVLDVRSDRQEGLSPEIEEYAAEWIDARTAGSSTSTGTFTVMLGTDGKTYLDGKEISIRRD